MSVEKRFQEPGELVVVEGLHAIKHALRFDADISCVAVRNDAWTNVEKICPDQAKDLKNLKHEDVSTEVFEKLSPRNIPTGFIALASKPEPKATTKPIIVLDNPKNIHNVGAIIRTLVAFDLSLGLINSDIDVFHPVVTRTGAGLNFGLQWQLFNETSQLPRPLIGLDNNRPDMQLDQNSSLDPNACYVFGSERAGVSKDIIAACDQIIEIPIADKVSSLSLPHTCAIIASRIDAI